MAAARSRKKPENQLKIVRERIEILFSNAEKEFNENPGLSHRWVQMARKIAERYNIHFSADQRRRFCRKCSRFLAPGKNCTVRTSPRQRAVIVKCLECGSVARFPYRKERKS